MKFPVFSLLAGNLAFSETSSQLTPPSSEESVANSISGTMGGFISAVPVQPRPSRSAGSDCSGRALRRTDRHCAAVRLDAGEQEGQPDKHHPRRHPFRRDIWGNRHIGECRLITSRPFRFSS